jgi:hypothetical protein
MASHTTDQGTDSRLNALTGDDDSSIYDPVNEIRPQNIPNTIITKAPEERFRLGYWSVIALVVNRVIGKIDLLEPRPISIIKDDTDSPY